MTIRICDMDENAAKQAAQMFQFHYQEQKLRADTLQAEIERLQREIDDLTQFDADDAQAMKDAGVPLWPKHTPVMSCLGQITRLRVEIDRLNAENTWLRSLIPPQTLEAALTELAEEVNDERK